MIAATLALLAGSALAQEGPAFCPGYVVELSVQELRVDRGQVTVRDGSGQVLEARVADDGLGVDPVAGDGTWCAPLPPICQGPLSLQVEIGGTHRTLVLPIPDDAGDQPRILATLAPTEFRGVIVRGEAGPPRADGPPGTPLGDPPPVQEPEPVPFEGAPPAPDEAPQAEWIADEPAGGGEQASAPVVTDRWMPVLAGGVEPEPGAEPDPVGGSRRLLPPASLIRRWSWAWAVAVGLALGVVAIAWGRARRRREDRVGATWRDLPRRGGQPMTVARGDLAAALAGPLAGRTLVTLGVDPGGLPPGTLRLEAGTLPAEVLDALVRAGRSGDAPAVLLLLDPAAPGAWRVDALAELSEVVADHFPVWVVDGPRGWPRWSPAAPAGT